jgi:hypothetical protein
MDWILISFTSWKIFRIGVFILPAGQWRIHINSTPWKICRIGNNFTPWTIFSDCFTYFYLLEYVYFISVFILPTVHFFRLALICALRTIFPNSTSKHTRRPTRLLMTRNTNISVLIHCMMSVTMQIKCNVFYDIFLRYNQQDVTYLNLFISITLYMFRVEPPPIITSSDCT